MTSPFASRSGDTTTIAPKANCGSAGWIQREVAAPSTCSAPLRQARSSWAANRLANLPPNERPILSIRHCRAVARRHNRVWQGRRPLGCVFEKAFRIGGALKDTHHGLQPFENVCLRGLHRRRQIEIGKKVAESTLDRPASMSERQVAPICRRSHPAATRSGEAFYSRYERRPADQGDRG